jgi:cephalosporin hydroxylase
MRTIRDNPSLFLVSTPIKIDVFESLLADHPNQPFVRSVCTGLREGFWPFANTHPQDWPLIHDMSDRPPKTIEEREFLRGQIE